MKTRTISFAYCETMEQVTDYVSKITNIVGIDNVNLYGINYTIPEVTVRCNKKQWGEIKFSLYLEKYYCC